MQHNPARIIADKRDGLELTADQIEFFVNGFSDGSVADYQMAAMAMAIYCRGMTEEETAHLTDSMLHSGLTLQWQDESAPRVDKHSTGGVGDKVSLPLAPLLACCGCQVPMLSGRGLGITGGTLDKLESIPGFRTDLDLTEMQRITEGVGCVITGASDELAPADKKLYGLRDVTATIASIPLITASIMSKKLAENLDALVLDVKYGNGTFMKTPEQGQALAESLVATGQRMGLHTSAILTDMNQPLGHMIGNTLEVQEAIDLLQDQGPADLRELTLALGSQLLVSCQVANSDAEAEQILGDHLSSGRGYEKFIQMIRAQGGDLEAPRPLATARELRATQTGKLVRISTDQLGLAMIELGGGRRLMNTPIDHGVGLELLVSIGDPIEKGQLLGRLFARDVNRETVTKQILDAIEIADQDVQPASLILNRIGLPTEG